MPGPEQHIPRIAFANANLAPSPAVPTLAIFHSAEWLGNYASEAGYDGVELHPLVHSAWHYGEAAKSGLLTVVSLHQSFRTAPEERGAFEENSSLQARLVNGPAGSLLLPNMAQSALWMGDVQTTANIRVPGVFYLQPTAQADRVNLASSNTSIKLFQPTDQVAEQLGADSVDSIMAAAQARGYNLACLDTYHAQRRFGKEEPGPVSDLDTSLGNLALASSAVHLSLNRNDIAGEDHIETRQDLVALLKRGEFTGRTAEIMAELRRQGSAIQHVVIELTLGGLKDVTGHRKLGDHQKAYAHIAEAVRGYWALAA